MHWFEDDGVKDGMVEIIADAVEESGVALNAFVIMDNHFHLLAQQGDAPLAAFMQPVVRRSALLLKGTLQLEDHVFGGRYWDRTCKDGPDLRTCIRYIHRNPVEAGCCVDPSDYPWSSHTAYARVLEAELWRPRLTVLRGVFATGSCRSETELCAEYVQFVTTEPLPSAIGTSFHHGDAIVRDLLMYTRPDKRGDRTARNRPDLRDVVRRGIAELCPELNVESVRSFRGTWISRIRFELVQRAARQGYPGCDIARYLHMSESRVSQIIRALPAFERCRRPARR